MENQIKITEIKSIPPNPTQLLIFYRTGAYIYHRRKKNENYIDYLSKARKQDEIDRYTKERLALRTAPDPSS